MNRDRLCIALASLAAAALAGCAAPALLRQPALRVVPAVDRDTAERTAMPPEAPPTAEIANPPEPEQLPRAGTDAGAAEPLAEELPLPPAMADDALRLEEVIASVEQSYPLIHAALAEMQIAEGKLVSAWGEFDLNLSLYTLNSPLGFYQNYRHGAGLKQPLWQGGYAFGEYRLGDGSFAPWYGERETDEGGEFKGGLGVPLWKDRPIDKRRAAVLQAALERDAVDPQVRAQVLEFVRSASQVYWSWVAAVRSLEAQQELLALARERAQQIEQRVEAGDLEEVALINNQQLIAARESKVIEAERKLQLSAIKLSLFLRTPEGNPRVPLPSDAPSAFPDHAPPPEDQLPGDIAAALRARPEFAELDLQRRQANVELASAENLMRPSIDAVLVASKDVGAQASVKGDKQPFELEAGLFGEVPLQRREGRGKIAAARGKLRQLAVKRRFLSDKVAAELQDAYSGLQTAAERIDRAQQYAELAERARQLAGEAFLAGDIDLVTLNLYEQAVNDAELQLIQAQADFFSSQADYRAALGGQVE